MEFIENIQFLKFFSLIFQDKIFIFSRFENFFQNLFGFRNFSQKFSLKQIYLSSYPWVKSNVNAAWIV